MPATILGTSQRRDLYNPLEFRPGFTVVPPVMCADEGRHDRDSIGSRLTGRSGRDRRVVKLPPRGNDWYASHGNKRCSTVCSLNGPEAMRS